ncbi:MAG: Nucleotide-binding protein [Nitrosopumilales archaeon]|nr:MAG: Nucleotide-binding protein [Nitrosopumilales archaeon]
MNSADMKGADCAYCGDFQDMPFECNYCKDPFCAEHRLPEEHRCVKLTVIRAKKFGQKKVIRDGGRNKPSFFKRMFGKS